MEGPNWQESDYYYYLIKCEESETIGLLLPKLESQRPNWEWLPPLPGPKFNRKKKVEHSFKWGS